MGEYFGEILKRAVNRRDVLKGGLFCTATAVVASCGGESGASDAVTSTPVLNFQSIQPNSDDRITIPQGFKHNVVIRWGDALDSGQNMNLRGIREQGVTSEDVERQKKCFGYNCDFVGYLEFRDPAGTTRKVLVVNHEYCNAEIMFKEPFLTSGSPTPGRPTAEESLLMLEAHGLSVVEVNRRTDGSWEYVRNSLYNRRITGSTMCEITGPARGHRLMRTYYDPNGHFVLGTLNNCAAGKTPWGTVLTCEENFHSYFGGSRSNIVIRNQDGTPNNAETGLVRSIHQR
ncbi:MAG: DUF839 domain-containing protein, partial [Aquificaceae bacterium]|nr:DUF839 domain-containing protein [Aquificaceae bacterium]